MIFFPEMNTFFLTAISKEKKFHPVEWVEV